MRGWDEGPATTGTGRTGAGTCRSWCTRASAHRHAETTTTTSSGGCLTSQRCRTAAAPAPPPRVSGRSATPTFAKKLRSSASRAAVSSRAASPYVMRRSHGCSANIRRSWRGEKVSRACLRGLRGRGRSRGRRRGLRPAAFARPRAVQERRARACVRVVSAGPSPACPGSLATGPRGLPAGPAPAEARAARCGTRAARRPPWGAPSFLTLPCAAANSSWQSAARVCRPVAICRHPSAAPPTSSSRGRPPPRHPIGDCNPAHPSPRSAQAAPRSSSHTPFHPQDPSTVLYSASPDGHEVLERLAHLQALDAQVPRVEEVVDPLAAALAVIVRLRLQGGQERDAAARRVSSGRFVLGSMRWEQGWEQDWEQGRPKHDRAGGRRSGSGRNSGRRRDRRRRQKQRQAAAEAEVEAAAQTCASSLSWCGNRRSSPPLWMSITDPPTSLAIALHSMCHPGRPGPQGLGQCGSPGLAAFQRAKSQAPRLSPAPPSPSPASVAEPTAHGLSLP